MTGASVTGSARQEELEALLTQTARAHHAAFAESDGEDPDWPIWYAEHLLPLIDTYLAAPMTRSRLVHCLVMLSDEHQVVAPEESWQSFYASRLLERYGPATSQAADLLALYYFPSCPYCQRVLAVVRELSLDIELRDILEDETHRLDLVEATGRSMVPVLKITSPDGSVRWMPESRDIVAYLRSTYSSAESA